MDFSVIIPDKDDDTSKKDYGSIAVVAGMAGMAGASALSAKAALRSGAGLVRVTAPSNRAVVINILAPEAIYVSPKEVIKHAAGFDAVAIGPGMGKTSGTVKALAKLFKLCTGPLVIDADGLNCLAVSERLARLASESAADIIITPHEAEAARLLGIPSVSDRDSAAEALAEKYNCTALLKGHQTIVIGRDGRRYVNETGNPGMATPGSGDVLTGIITALAGQGLTCFDAACAGAYIHGSAGDLAAEQRGEYGMTAADIIDKLPEAFLSCKGF